MIDVTSTLDVDRRGIHIAELHPVGERQVLHRLMDIGEIASGNVEVAPSRRTAGENHGVVARHQDIDIDVLADDGPGSELGALGDHLLEPSVDVALLHLEFGDAVSQESTDPIEPAREPPPRARRE